MNGWVLLHKKIWDSVVTSSPYALTIWIWLLTHCDENGTVTCGRNQIAKETRINPETVRYWTTRFLRENNQLTTIKTTNKYSQFQICKWEEYQRKTTNKTTEKLPTNYQQTTTNKEERIKKELDTDVSKGHPGLNELMDHAKSRSFSLQGSTKINRQYAYNLLRNKEVGLDRAKWLVDAAVSSRGKPYAPTVNDFKTLFYKWTDLLTWYQKKGDKNGRVVRINNPRK